MYYVYVAVLFLALGMGWLMTLAGLPGNWFIVGVTALFAWVVPESTSHGIGWTAVAWMAGLAMVAELLEFAAGAAGLAKGGSKKGAFMSIVGSFAGALVGAAVGFPIPVLGSLFGIVIFAAAGAMAGTFVGERWAGKNAGHAVEIGKVAFWGRLFGSVAKIAIGSILVAVAVAAALL